MAETPLSTARADAKSGTTDPNADYVNPAIGESVYYSTWYKMMDRIQTIINLVNEFRVGQDGDLTFLIRAGKASHANAVYTYAGASAQALTDDDTTSIWLQVDSGILTLYTGLSGFPDPAVTPHIPVATVAVGSESTGAVSGTYDDRDIVDFRGRCIFEIIG